MRTFEIILTLVLALRIIAGAFLPRRGRNALTTIATSLPGGGVSIVVPASRRHRVR